MAISRFSRRVLALIAFGIALPALLLAALGIFLTLRIGRAVEDQTLRYNSYMAKQVARAYELELLVDLRRAIALAENAARAGADEAAIERALDVGMAPFGPPHVVRLEGLGQYSMLVLESQPVVYGQRPDGRWFAGIMLRDPRGQIMGAGGWWFDPETFLRGHLATVVHDRMPADPRMYGGFESTRQLSVELLGPRGDRLAAVRQPRDTKTARSESLEGPFEGYHVRVAATADAPAVWARRFVVIEVGFIGVMGLLILLATLFGVRYTVRQVELAQLKSGFVSNVTHELKTPIALIRLAVETLQMRRVTSPEETEKFLGTIGRETLRLSQLVDNILDFARIESGRVTFHFQPMDLADVVREALETFRPRFEHLGFRVEVAVPDHLPRIEGDAPALTHCLLNLLDNAVKYSRARREVQVSAATRDHEVLVSVADRGIGISTRDQKRIFEKFVRLETGLVHDVKGAGLGLSLVDQVIRAHGGRVELVSSPGEGSTFTLVLPAAGGEAEVRPELRVQTGS